MSATFLSLEATQTLAASYATQPSEHHRLVLDRLTADMLLAAVGQERAIAYARMHIAHCAGPEQVDLVYASAHAILSSLSLVYRGERFSSLLQRVNAVRDQVLGRRTQSAPSPAYLPAALAA